MNVTDSIGGPLFRHDMLIAANSAKAIFNRWLDRMILSVFALGGLAVIRSWLLDRLWTTAALAVLAASLAVGIGVGRMVEARLAFHAFDGVLAAEALHPPTSSRYRAAWHGIGLVVLTAIALIARPSLVMIAVGGYAAGLLAAELLRRLSMPWSLAGRRRPVWVFRRWLHLPGTGAVAAMALLLSLLPAHGLAANILMAFVGTAALLLTFALTIVDDSVVRFQTIAGHGSWRIIGSSARGVAAFALVAIPGCWLVNGPAVAGVVAAVIGAALLFMILRILAYRLHTKRFADLVLSFVVGLMLLIAYAIPVAVPVVGVMVFWQLHRRGTAKVWLLA